MHTHVEAAGYSLSVRWWPEDAASAVDQPTLILLHEGLGSISLWRDFPAQLAAATGCRVLTYARPGYGQSAPHQAPRTPRYMHDEALLVLPALLETLAIERPILVGHSDGGSIGLIFAGAFPVRLRAMVAIAPHEWVEEEALAGIRLAGEAWQNSDWPERLARHHADADKVFRDWHDTWLSPAFRDWNILDYVDLIRCPLLALQGDKDEYATMRQIDTLAERVPGCRAQVLADCGHSPHREQPTATVAAIADFVRQLPAD
jgi:pimeloyl-ACP methyl ester carboxylesterase